MAKLTKVSGAGNHFLVADLRAHFDGRNFVKEFRTIGKTSTRANLAREWSNPYHSLGADGVLFLESSRFADVRWDFYNADGSRAEMCGNAARCVGRYLHETTNPIRSKRRKGLKPRRTFSIETLVGVIHANVDKSVVHVEMPALKALQSRLTFELDNRVLEFDFVNSGVPHAVCHLILKGGLKSLIANESKLQRIANAIRKLDMFKKSGTNVTFVVKRTSSRIDSLTFERGVHGFTQACGTGAVAAAVSFSAGQRKSRRKRNSPHYYFGVDVPGGHLEVNLEGPRPILTGSARIIAKIETIGDSTSS